MHERWTETAATPIVAEGVEFRRYEVCLTNGEGLAYAAMATRKWRSADERIIVWQPRTRETWCASVDGRVVAARRRTREAAMFAGVKAAG